MWRSGHEHSRSGVGADTPRAATRPTHRASSGDFATSARRVLRPVHETFCRRVVTPREVIVTNGSPGPGESRPHRHADRRRVFVHPSGTHLTSSESTELT